MKILDLDDLDKVIGGTGCGSQPETERTVKCEYCDHTFQIKVSKATNNKCTCPSCGRQTNIG